MASPPRTPHAGRPQGRPVAALARRRPAEMRAWLRQEPPLEELCQAFPAEWAVVEQELASLAAGTPEAVAAYAAGLSAPVHVSAAAPATERERQLLALEARRLMAASALRAASFAAATGRTGGRVRFNLLNGYVAQRLLFARGLERKPVSLAWYRVVWPILWQRRLLMPLVQRQGIYCFYSRRLVAGLAALIGDRPCLELAAGDGTLARFLADVGVDVTATDDWSWQREIRYPASVLRQDARTALRTHRPRVVVCSWPPVGNDFERHVFATESVELYVAINGSGPLVSGNHADYAAQTAFDHDVDARLGRLVLPRTLGAQVHVFRRRPAAGA